MDPKEKYINLCVYESGIPVFSQPWFLDAVCGKNNWNVLIYEENGEIIATYPFYQKKKFLLLDIITMPCFTPIMGPWLRYSAEIKSIDKLSFEKKIFTYFINNLPSVDYIFQQFHNSITNWLPFYWQGFKQTTNYTYIIHDIDNLDNVFKNFSYSKRKHIKKSENILTVKFDLDARSFFDHHSSSLNKHGKVISYSFELFEGIFNKGYENNAAKTLYAVDSEGNLHGALFILWDKNSAYNLISSFDPDFRNSGASSLLVWEAIKLVSGKTKAFDMEGSMFESVEESFRNFGAIQTPYFAISKNNSWLLRLYNFLFNKYL